MSARSLRWRRVAALISKESRQVLRDPSSILIAFVLPVVLLALYGYAISLDAGRTRLGLVVERDSPLARDLAASFHASRFFLVEEAPDRRLLEQDLVRGRLRGLVVIPARLADDLTTGRAPRIQLILDGLDPNTATFVRSYVQSTLAGWTARRQSETGAAGPAITLHPRFWFNPEGLSRYFLVPGAIAIVMSLVGTLLTSLVIAREWERGTMEAMMATPLSATEILVGKLLPYFVLGLVAMTICLVLAVTLFAVPFRGSLVALYLLSACFLVPALGQGLLISAVTRNQFLASQLALISGFLPSFLLSGFLYEIDSMPRPIQWFTQIVPARHLIPSLQSVFLTGDVWPMFLPAMGKMGLIGAVFFAIALRRTRKRID